MLSRPFFINTPKQSRIKKDLVNMIVNWQEEITRIDPDIKFRADAGDGDPDKEANFYIIKNAPCPAMLVENLFMDNEADCRKLLDPGFRDKLAGVYVEFIKKILS